MINEEQASTAILTLLELAKEKEPRGGIFVIEGRCAVASCPIRTHHAVIVVRDPRMAKDVLAMMRAMGATDGGAV